jgi:hypothetical protein
MPPPATVEWVIGLIRSEEAMTDVKPSEKSRRVIRAVVSAAVRQ